jgi:hypothetical protein
MGTVQNVDVNNLLGTNNGNMSIMDYYKRARGRAERKKSPWNLVQIPLTVAGTWLIYEGFCRSMFSLVGHFRPAHENLASYAAKDTRDFIRIAIVVASYPLGMMVSNTVLWLVPPLRRIQDKEASMSSGTDFKISMLGLLKFALFSVPIGLGIATLIAVFGG